MEQHTKKHPVSISEQELGTVSGGSSNWWEEYGYYPKYSIGQRVFCTYFYDDFHTCGYIDSVGTIRKIDFFDKGPDSFNYLIELDTPDSSGEKFHWVFADRILGPA